MINMPKPEPRYITPSLESITVRGKYSIPQTDFSIVEKKIAEALSPSYWMDYEKIGESITLLKMGHELMETARNLVISGKNDELTEDYKKHIKDVRSGVAIYFSIATVEHLDNGILVEVECRPAMWYRISQFGEESFRENEIQEALLECRSFVKRVMSIFRGKEVEPVSVYPIIQRTEIKSRLLNLGLRKIVSLLDEAEKHVTQNNFTACLKSSRTAFEKMIDWEMKKRGLEQTNNYKNNLERLKSKGYLGSETTKLLQSYYRCLSSIAVHEKGEAETGIYEAQMGYGITLIMLDYFANKLP